MAARLVALAFVVAGCTYPATQMEPVERRGERFDAAVTDAVERGDFAAAHRLCDAWLELARESGTVINMVAAHETIAWVDWAEGDDAGALAEVAAMGDWSRRTDGERRRAGLSHFFSLRAWLLAETGRADEAAAAYAELTRNATHAGDREWLAVLRAWISVSRGDLASANRALAEVNVAADDDPLDLFVFARVRASQAEDFQRRVRAGPRTRMRAVVLQRWSRK